MRSLLIVFLLAALPAHALVIDIPLENAEQESRARSLFLQLRCQVCEGQSVADSDAIIAQQLRKLVRAQITQGQSDGDIRNFLAERYGQDILFRTSQKQSSLPLWVAPIVFLIIGGVIFAVRRRA